MSSSEHQPLAAGARVVVVEEALIPAVVDPGKQTATNLS